MANDNEFLGGIRFQFPRDNAPSFNRCRGWVDIAEAIAFLQAKQAAGETKLNFNVNESKDGTKLIGYVDNWKPNGNGTPRNNAPKPQRRDEPAKFDDAPFDDSIPFISARGVF